MRRVLLWMTAVGVVFIGLVSSAFGASSIFLCVPSTAGEAVTSGGSTGTCTGGARSVALPSEKTEQEKLISILPYIKYEEKSTLDKKPLIQFSGINLQAVDGEGSETKLNGTGNLILGYDEKPGTQTGSHNLVLATSGQSYSSYGGILGGYDNTISGRYASILGGALNTASGAYSTISGGYANQATTIDAAVDGGCSNLAGTGTPTVSSVCINPTYAGDFPTVLGGTGNQASAENASVSGGTHGEASGVDASVTGGSHGKAKYFASTVLGGLEEEPEKELLIAP